MKHRLRQNKKDLSAIYEAALAAVDGRTVVANTLDDVELSGPLFVVALGKAAAAMYQGAQQALGGAITQALVISKVGHLDDLVASDVLIVCEAGHPWPTQASLDAGQALLAFITDAPAEARFLFLISGGASSLVEVLAEGVSLDDVFRLNDWLLSSGLDISAMNHVRKAVSRIKGGRLAPYLQGRQALVLLISDVPGDDPATIGSGLLVADGLLETEAPFEFPDWVEQLMSRASPMPATHDASFDSIDVDVVACLADAKRAAADEARRRGYRVYEDGAVLAGDAIMVARRLATELLNAEPGLYIWGGETTMCLPEQPGRGGRNQSLALAAAIELEGRGDVVLLAAATDGSDGPTQDAGAIVDGTTVQLAEQLGLEAVVALASADAGSLLAATGSLIQTGPTGTNVMDIMIGMKL